MRHVAIVGASLAGVHAAEGLRQEGFEGGVTLINAESEPPYDRPPLSKLALRGGTSSCDLLLRAPEWYEEHDVELLLGREAQGLDLTANAVVLDGGERVRYDGLVLATGSIPRQLPPPADAGILSLRTSSDCLRLHNQLRSGGHLLVIGAGFIGLEVAATARQMGLAVSVVELAPAPLARVLGLEVGSWFKNLHEANGVAMYCGDAVDTIERSGTSARVRLRSGTEITADAMVAGVGAVPAVDWLATSGLALSGGGVRCDSYLGTSAPNVLAAGDIAYWYNPLYAEHMRVEHWTNAVEQGRFAARSLLGVADGPYVGPPYFWSDQFDAKTRFVGRAVGAEHVHVEFADAHSLVALYGRGGVLEGVVCVNAPRKLITYRQAVMDRRLWPDVVAGV